MANPQKGEIEFQIDGKAYTYLLGTYGLAKLEQRMGKPWPTVIKQAQESGWGVDAVLAVFHCGLLLHHEPMTEKEASQLLDELTVVEFINQLGRAWKMQFGESDANPPNAAAPKAVNGIGIPSSAIG